MFSKSLFSANLCSRLISLPVFNMNQTASYSNPSGLGDLGSGAGHGGGDGGSVRQAGGSMGKREAAFEGEYFNRLQKQQLEDMKKSMHDDLSFHKEQIKRHEEALKKLESRIKKAE